MTHDALTQPDRLPGTARQRIAVATAPVLLALFMATTILPVSFEIAGLRLTPIRILLLLSFIPMLGWLFAGRAGKIILPDILIMFLCVWIFVTLLYHDGISRLAFSGISAVELLGGYLLGRCLIRNVVDFKRLIRLHLICLMVMFPFATVEFLTGRQIWAEILDVFGSVVYRGDSSRPRMGFDRVLGGFEHPILFGLFCSMAAANVVYVWRDKLFAAFSRLGFVVVITFMSLSSGALLSVMIQALLVVWDFVMKSRWKLLIVLTAIAYVVVELLSNRGPILIFIETMTFSSGTAWTRVNQWEFGSAEVLRNPILGKGITSNWIRPAWMHSSSIDNYWLVVAFRHGLPAIIALLGAFAIMARRAVRAKNLPQEVQDCRTGYLIVLAGITFTLATVHIWGAIVVYVFFYLGAGSWLADAGEDSKPDADDPPEEPSGKPDRSIAYRRPRVTKAGTEQPGYRRDHPIHTRVRT